MSTTTIHIIFVNRKSPLAHINTRQYLMFHLLCMYAHALQQIKFIFDKFKVDHTCLSILIRKEQSVYAFFSDQ